jgi:ABC-type multidrug transport system fused ATPase/permease subunit
MNKLFKQIGLSKRHSIYFLISVLFISSLEISFWGLFAVLISVEQFDVPEPFLGLLNNSSPATLLIIVVIFRFLLQTFHSWFIHFSAFTYLTRLRDYLVKNTIEAGYSNFEVIGKAKLTTDIITNTAIFVDAVYLNYMKIISDLASLLIVASAIVYFSGAEALIIIAVLLFFGILGVFFLKDLLLGWSFSITESVNQLNKLTDYLLYSLKEIKVNKLGSIVGDQHHLVHNDISATQTKIRFTQLFPRYAVEAIFFGVVGLVVMFSENQPKDAQLAIMSSLAFYVLAGMRSMPLVNQLMICFNGVRSGQGAQNQLVNHIDELTSFSIASKISYELDIGEEEVSLVVFKGVSFSYDKKDVITNLSCDLRRGNVVLFSGPSGSGKSTALDLLLGIRAPLKGTIHIRKNLSFFYVSQHPFFPSCSISEYFKRVCPDIKWEEIQPHLAELKLFELADNPDYYLGEAASNLSGGQRQLICLIVSVLLQPDVVVFDETTSGLDSHSEGAFFDMLRSKLPSSLVVIISHRLKTKEVADQTLNFPT